MRSIPLFIRDSDVFKTSKIPHFLPYYWPYFFFWGPYFRRPLFSFTKEVSRCFHDPVNIFFWKNLSANDLRRAQPLFAVRLFCGKFITLAFQQASVFFLSSLLSLTPLATLSLIVPAAVFLYGAKIGPWKGFRGFAPDFLTPSAG